jgi:hypothetical protein
MAGAEVHLTAVEPDGTSAMVGDAVRPRVPLTVAAEVRNGTGQRLRLVANGEVLAEQPIVAPSQTVEHRVVLPAGGWLRAELFADRGYAMSCLTSPIYALGRRSGPTRSSAEISTGPPATYGDPLAAERLLPILRS